MSATPDPLAVAFEGMAQAPEGRVLAADRRPAGAELPTVPVAGERGRVVELTREQVACALFEVCGGELPETAESLHEALVEAVRGERYGVDFVRAQLPDFMTLSPFDFPEIAHVWQVAHRVTVHHWYADARSRELTAGELAVYWYLCDCDDPPADGAPHSGAYEMDGRQFIELGARLTDEHVAASPTGHQSHRYLGILPDRQRRRRCFEKAWRYGGPVAAPLLVAPDWHPRPLLGSVAPTAPYADLSRPLRPQE